ncbi:MAG: hypothetical protein HYU71_05235 [Bacteroidetes bacterium]|nr:hypothetical protein [Bacteroidota bacterium]
MEINKLQDKKKFILNVLVVLTFIGSSLNIISAIWQYETIEENMGRMNQILANSDNKIPEFAKKFVNEDALEMTKKLVQNKLPFLTVSLIGSLLCLYGAFQMRKLKKEGYYLYLMGAIFPFLTFPIFVGWNILSDRFVILNILLSLIFIIFYSSQKKILTQI